MQLLKFQKRVLQFLAISIALITFFLFFFKFIYFNSDYPEWKVKMDYVKKAGGSHNIIIGDSRAAAAFIPEDIGQDFYNLSLGGCTSIEAYYLMKKYLSKNKVTKLIISFSPIHFESDEVFMERTLKFNLLSAGELNDVLNTSLEYNEKFFHLPSDPYSSSFEFRSQKIEALLTQFKWFWMYRGDLKSFLLNPNRFYTNLNRYSDIKVAKGHTIYGTADGNSELNLEAKRSKFRNSKVIKEYFHKLLDLAISHKVEIFYISTPFNTESYTSTRQIYYQNYNSFFSEVITRYKESDIFWAPDIIEFDNEYFGDDSHLNRRGQAKFSKQIKEMLSTN